METLLKVIGIDPGSLTTGYGIVSFLNGDVVDSEYGVIELSSYFSFAEKLYGLSQRLDEVLTYAKPDHLALEKIFLGKNAQSAFKLGSVRGICLEKAVQHQLKIFEYNATSVKKNITGLGSASKFQLQTLVLNRLGISDFQEKEDASDALALAVVHYDQFLGKENMKKRMVL